MMAIECTESQVFDVGALISIETQVMLKLQGLRFVFFVFCPCR